MADFIYSEQGFISCSLRVLRTNVMFLRPCQGYFSLSRHTERGEVAKWLCPILKSLHVSCSRTYAGQCFRVAINNAASGVCTNA